jgi:intraflagellar transport protein 46
MDTPAEEDDESPREEDAPRVAGGDGAPGALGVPPAKAAFNPSTYAALKVSEEVREILELIGRFVPRPVELPTPLRPFIPDFIPCVSEVDAFLKPDRPDGRAEELGLRRLDEPSPSQSDPTVLDLRLRALSKKSGLAPVAVRAIENAERNPREIAKWVASIRDLHRTRPPPSVRYTRPMPDIDALMAEWPPGFEVALREAPLPGGDTDVSAEEYARIACVLLDIPVYPTPSGGEGKAGNQLVQSLHVLFTLYDSFRSSAHFRNIVGEPQGGLEDNSY